MDEKYVLVEKEVLENLIATINDMKERLENVEDNTAQCLNVIFDIGEKLKVL